MRKDHHIRAVVLPNGPSLPATIAIAHELIDESSRKGIAITKRARASVARNVNHIRRRARRAGFKAGWDASLAALPSVITRLEFEFREATEQLTVSTRLLALKIAEEILMAEISTNALSITNRIMESCDALPRNEIVEIRLHPEVTKAVADKSFAAPLSEDSNIAPGDILLKTRKGQVTLSWRAHYEAFCEDISTPRGTTCG